MISNPMGTTKVIVIFQGRIEENVRALKAQLLRNAFVVLRFLSFDRGLSTSWKTGL
jgi:hypothetical protein